MSSFELRSFPSNSVEALAMFYVQNVVFPSMKEGEATPESLTRAYLDAYAKFNLERAHQQAPARTGN